MRHNDPRKEQTIDVIKKGSDELFEIIGRLILLVAVVLIVIFLIWGASRISLL